MGACTANSNHLPTSDEASDHLSPQQSNDDASEKISEKSNSASPPAVDSGAQKRRPSTVSFELDSQGPGPSDITLGIRLYFDYCHRQPIWCFEREEISDYGAVPEHLLCSILALAARFSYRKDQLQRYGAQARQLIMFRIVNGTVDITTMESLCLLSYSSFIDGNAQMGQFYLGLGLQLCRSAMLDMESMYTVDNAVTERRKRLFWSLQVLEQYYGNQTGLLAVPTEMLRPPYAEGQHRSRMEPESKAPPLPRDDLGHSVASSRDPGVWNTSVHLGWVWSRVRKYVSDCAHNIFNEPWRRDSMYAMVLSDFMETENRIPMCHRYDTVKFYERKIDELKSNRDYWATWLKEQFTYHAIHTVLNHPFLYIIGAQHNPNLAIPNTFWRRSSELALLHSTWIVRLIDMVLDKQVHLVDPFFGHIAAIAATVHLYYCCAAAAKLKHKSNTDFAKCRRFLKSFIPFSSACATLDTNLDRMTRIAAGSESVDVEDWMPSRIYLSIPIMWDILQFNCSSSPKPSLLDPSLTIHNQTLPEDELLEIIVATSPEIVINTADGGQDAPTLPFKPNSMPTTSQVSEAATFNETGALTLNTTPWLYEDSLPFMNMEDVNVEDTDTRMAWWEGDFPGMYDF